MIRKMTCIECPRGCSLSVDIEGCRVVQVSGNLCPKGIKFAAAEVENPVRVFTSSVLAIGLSLKMVPVRTAGAIPRHLFPKAMEEVKRMRLRTPVEAGEVLVRGFLGQGTDLVATRQAK